MRTVIYARVSTDDPRQAGSCATQVERCRAYCAAVGYEVVAEYIDDGVSGRTMDRPGWRAVEAALRSGAADLVLSTDLDRQARTKKFWDFVEFCAREGKSFATLREKIDTSTAVGRLLLSILLAFGEFFVDQTAEKVSGARRSRAINGYLTTYCPFGTQPGPERGVPVLDPQRWPVVERIFELAALGCSDAEILADPLVAAATTARGARLGATTLNRVIAGRFYLGQVGHGGEWFEAKHACRIDPELWQRAQRQRQARPGRRTETYTYLLDGLAETSHYRITWPAERAGQSCPLRHRPIHNGKGGRYPMYCRADRMKTFGGVQVEPVDAGAALLPKYMLAEELDRAVVEWLIEQVDSGALKARLDAELAESDEQLGELRERRDGTARALASARGQYTILAGRAVQLNLDGKLHMLDAVERRLEQLAGEIRDGADLFEALEAAVARLEATELDAAEQASAAELVRFAWEAGELTDLQQLLQGLIRRVDVRMDGIRLDMYALPPGRVCKIQTDLAPTGIEPVSSP